MVSCDLTATLQQNKEKYFDRNSYRRISLRVKNVQSYSVRERKQVSLTTGGAASATPLRVRQNNTTFV